MSGSAFAAGSPPTAGVGCSSSATCTSGSGSASWARIGVPRCCTLRTLTRTGSSAAVTHTLTGSSARVILRVTIACSSRSFGDCISCSPR